eukprot:TRINITY_DN14435_c0_g1_i1.p1 TRINITY_DN14435_c0_g1~~TRINITY_DN14435_c0_g1_i1.p1  ORF type:complete len:146 (+),score=22.54 TRINITY_DN14435_c0_g1_i1:216-653(+)
MGMNCSIKYGAEGLVGKFVVMDAINTIMEHNGLTPTCGTVPDYGPPPPPSECVDAPEFGKINSIALNCTALLATSKSSYYDTCAFLAERTLGELVQYWSEMNVSYTPPPGYPASTHGVDLCKGVCGASAVGPCWTDGVVEQSHWC